METGGVMPSEVDQIVSAQDYGDDRGGGSASRTFTLSGWARRVLSAAITSRSTILAWAETGRENAEGARRTRISEGGRSSFFT
eukprot:CAMPEP_0180227058 /NCGR_PEP_ID=MMETSP0987-20121128/23891_1 /TAXON_ID=697907 /ORGANISM="non described non described, Strain CCMP2293" /LENGTH=82 /DNA_ID=CAMNT_0022190887 /DNA_START=87 /DNA_END=336 /DNA_ORIENTATION=-